ncbi:hypothetical protein SAMN05660443_2470 [Marinospirillum celere]|uniref:LPP20 lipoprotein n=1 Tax=Marinospirillum celere TaxID=1122252 RepID=A0A1I1IRH9_9GAMM|nr:hypothetical protein [Marinospirillum celere]SFC38834.1 hypothetical protein SAMN05660443_2470 [Marinospirillum celere]
MAKQHLQLTTFVLVLILIAGCSSTPTASTDPGNHQYTQTPCWLHTPYSSQAQGVIAITAEFGSGDTKALSREMAVASLAEVYNLSTQGLDEQDIYQNTISLSGHSIGLAPTWTHAGQHISYAYLANTQADHWVLNSCAQPRCQPERCSPSWLCEENTNHYLSAVTVSQLAATQREQYRFLFENALAQLRTTHGVKVEASRAQLHTRSGSALNLSSYLREREHSSFQFSEMSGSVPLVLTDSCRYDTTLYGRLMLKGVTNPHADLLPINQDWHLDLSSPGEGMAVGHFSGMLSHNLISLRIEYALRNALLELARSHQVQITSDQLHINNLDGGYYSMELVTEDTQMQMRVRVRSVRFLGTSDDPDVYVLVEGM